VKLKDKYKNCIEIFQARNGSIHLLFANSNIELNKKQVEALVGSNVYDIENFDQKLYLKFYK
jgi:hypothetical protein